MRRLFWVALGATAGILVVRKVGKLAHSLTPEGAASKASGAVNNLAQAVRDFSDDVKAGMAERDVELRNSLGITDDGLRGDAYGNPDRAVVEYLLKQEQHPGGRA